MTGVGASVRTPDEAAAILARTAAAVCSLSLATFAGASTFGVAGAGGSWGFAGAGASVSTPEAATALLAAAPATFAEASTFGAAGAGAGAGGARGLVSSVEMA